MTRRSREAVDRFLRYRPSMGDWFDSRPKGTVRSCVYYRMEDVPRRPAYAIDERVSHWGDSGTVQSSHVAHCGPNGGYMWTYWLLLDSGKLCEHAWEEDIRSLARRD